MKAHGYDAFYEQFESPLMRQVRREAYGEDIGQHSWVTADELRADVARLGLNRSSHIVDLGCGPCGPLTFVLADVRCRGTGADVNTAAVHAGRSRAQSLAVDDILTVCGVDMNATLPFARGSFDAAMSLDVVLHLQDRASFFREVARVLRPGGRFLLIDAGVVSGPISGDEVRKRGQHGHTVLVPPGCNETLLTDAGFRIVETENRTKSAMTNAAGRISAMTRHRQELVEMLGNDELDAQLAYLSTVVELSRRRALSRMMYLAEIALPM